jgi:hypothetical protein
MQAARKTNGIYLKHYEKVAKCVAHRRHIGGLALISVSPPPTSLVSVIPGGMFIFMHSCDAEHPRKESAKLHLISSTLGPNKSSD